MQQDSNQTAQRHPTCKARPPFQRLAYRKTISMNQLTIICLENGINLALANKENELKIATIKSGFENTIKLKDEQIAQIQDFRKKLSTKMLGETLEQHCLLSCGQVLV